MDRTKCAMYLTVILLPLLKTNLVAAWQWHSLLDFDAYSTQTKAINEPKKFIVGGEEAAQSEFTFVAAIIVHLEDGNGQLFCAGSIINETTILTAAHCTPNVEYFQVIVGCNDFTKRDKSQQHFNTSCAVVHPLYDQNTAVNDIALLVLPEKIKFNKFVSSIRLPSSHKADYSGKQGTMIGWGSTSNDSPGVSTVQRKAKARIMNYKKCQKKGYWTMVTSNNICTDGKDMKGTCSGDSGGPLIVTNEDGPILVGCTSFGMASGCGTGSPSVFTAVCRYLDFIGCGAVDELEPDDDSDCDDDDDDKVNVIGVVVEAHKYNFDKQF